MTAKEALYVLKNPKGSIFYGDEYGICFKDEWVQAYEMAIAVLEKEAAKE